MMYDMQYYQNESINDRYLFSLMDSNLNNDIESKTIHRMNMLTKKNRKLTTNQEKTNNKYKNIEDD